MAAPLGAAALGAPDLGAPVLGEPVLGDPVLGDPAAAFAPAGLNGLASPSDLAAGAAFLAAIVLKKWLLLLEL